MVKAGLSRDVSDSSSLLVVAGIGVYSVRFPPEVIVVAVRWYVRYSLSYREVEELLVERGIEVDHVTLFRWVQRFTPLPSDAARFARHAPGDRRFGRCPGWPATATPTLRVPTTSSAQLSLHDRAGWILHDQQRP